MKYVAKDGKFLPDYLQTGCLNSFRKDGIDIPLNCGKCLPCKAKRRSDWSFRLQQEYNGADSAFFITLTYNEMFLPKTDLFEYVDKDTGEIMSIRTSTLNKIHVQKYIKRLRNDHVRYVSDQLKIPKSEVKNVSKPVRYYLVGEYGSKTRRPHYHLLLFNYDIANLAPITDQWKCTTTKMSYGHVDIGTVTGASIDYVTKYMHKDFNRKTDKRLPPFTLMSKKPIIGQYYLDNFKGWHMYYEELSCKNNNGNTQRLPKAFFRRIFPDIKMYEDDSPEDKAKIIEFNEGMKEYRRMLSEKSLSDFQEKRIIEYERIAELNYGGDMIAYMNSLESDKLRNTKTILNKETL